MNTWVDRLRAELADRLDGACQGFVLRWGEPSVTGDDEVEVSALRIGGPDGGPEMLIGVACNHRLRPALTGFRWRLSDFRTGTTVREGSVENANHFRLRDLSAGEYSLEIALPGLETAGPADKPVLRLWVEAPSPGEADRHATELLNVIERRVRSQDRGFRITRERQDPAAASLGARLRLDIDEKIVARVIEGVIIWWENNPGKTVFVQRRSEPPVAVGNEAELREALGPVE